MRWDESLRVAVVVDDGDVVAVVAVVCVVDDDDDDDGKVSSLLRKVSKIRVASLVFSSPPIRSNAMAK